MGQAPARRDRHHGDPGDAQDQSLRTFLAVAQLVVGADISRSGLRHSIPQARSVQITASLVTPERGARISKTPQTGIDALQHRIKRRRLDQ
jgi:hypothetical protein